MEGIPIDNEGITANGPQDPRPGGDDYHAGMRPNQLALWTTNGTHASPPPLPHVARNGGGNEWYTPREFIAVARQVLGTIDLDPASTAQANTVVQATRFFTVSDNGLHQRWQGKVWLNPPYGRPLLGQFLRKLCYHLEAGDVPEALVLVNNATETQWFQTIARVASAVCFPVTRTRYLRPEDMKPKKDPIQGQALLYCGPHPDGFTWQCRRLGHVWMALPGRPDGPERTFRWEE